MADDKESLGGLLDLSLFWGVTDTKTRLAFPGYI